MYRRPKFLEILHEIREEMSREADYDMDLFAELARSGRALSSAAGKKSSSSPLALRKEFSMPDAADELWSIELHDTKS